MGPSIWRHWVEGPEIQVLLAGGEVGSPWLNAGVIACPKRRGFWQRLAYDVRIRSALRLGSRTIPLS